MKSWYRTSKDIDTKDGTMVRIWITVFETDDYALSEASVEWCREMLNDAVPVRHGKWIHRGCGVFTCDKCSRDIGLNVYTTEKGANQQLHELIRCKECKYHRGENACEKDGCYGWYDTDYCSRAERKEDHETD